MTRAIAVLVLSLLLGLPACTYEQGDSAMSEESGETFDGGSGGGAMGWSGGGDMVSGDTSRTQGLQANFKKPGAYTALFSINPVGPAFPPGGGGLLWAPIQAEATLRWSVKGNTITRKITVTNGASVTGVAEGVSITIDDVSSVPASTPTDVLGRTYQAFVTVAPGTRASDTVPPILYPGNEVHQLATGNHLVLDVPQNCGIKSVLVTVAALAATPIPEQSVKVAQYGPGNNVMAYYDPRSMFFVPLLPGVSQIDLRNNSGQTLDFAVVYGVDG